MNSIARFLGTYKAILFVAVFSVPIILLQHVDAATIISYNDTISDSAPSEYSNHTINFTLTEDLDPGDIIRFRPPTGAYTIPATNFSSQNVQLYVATSSGYVARPSATSSSPTEDGVSITSGTSGNILLTLNSSTGLPSGATGQLRIGTHTENATTTDLGILNPTATGTQPIQLEFGPVGNPDQYTAHVAHIESINVGPIDTTETDPPVRFNGAPSGELSGTTLNVEMSLRTNEFATCRYSTASGTPFSSMPSTFDQTSFSTIHTKEIAVATSTSYTFYVRCIDDEGNFNTDDFVISFSVPEFPEGQPGDPGDEEDPGGTGSSGTDGGSDGSDEGSSSSGSSGSGGGGGSGGSGGSGNNTGTGGGFSGTGPFQSGDGRVIINGFAFPRSQIYILVDGQIAEQVRADSDGEFSATIDEIARGTYTFGVYAVDSRDTRSSTFSTSFLVTGSRGSTLSNVNVMPSILVEPDPVDIGQTLTVSGYSIPDATVTIENQNDTSSVSLQTFSTNSDSSGFWTTDIDTSRFSRGTYKVRAKSRQSDGVSTNFSEFTFYGVGQEADIPLDSDLNRDGSVNLIDFSILLFWWNSDGGASDPPADINQDGTVSLTDFSIMIFNWTG